MRWAPILSGNVIFICRFTLCSVSFKCLNLKLTWSEGLTNLFISVTSAQEVFLTGGEGDAPYFSLHINTIHDFVLYYKIFPLLEGGRGREREGRTITNLSLAFYLAQDIYVSKYKCLFWRETVREMAAFP